MKYVLCLLVVVSACSKETKTENAVVLDTASNTPVTEVYEPIESENADAVTAGSDIFQFENDDVGGDPFAKDFESMLASLARFDIEKKPFQNLHDSTRTDTLMIVRFGPSAIEYYKVQSNNSGFVLEANIRSGDIELKKGIRIGMTRKQFFSLFEELDGKPDLKSVIISTMEGLNQTEFLFAGDTLSAVKYQSYFD